MVDSIYTPLGDVLPSGWKLVPLGEMCQKIGSGATPLGGASVYVQSGTAFIRSQNVLDHRFSEIGLARIDSSAAEKLSGAAVAEGDVLLNITGDGPTIARSCIAPKEVLPARVNQHVLIIRVSNALDPRYLQRYLSHPAMRSYMLNHSSGGSRRALTKRHVESFPIAVPPIGVQRAIGEVLGALDDKIAVNERIARTTRLLGMAHFERESEAVGVQPSRLGDLASVIVRGISPRYDNSEESLLVLNQKCIREGRVNLSSARRTLGAHIKAPKMLKRHDVLVNSTGVGTLGRVACWTDDIEATVDTHITIVRFDSRRVDPVCAGFAMLAAQNEIEDMGEGSTGQTELRRTRLEKLEIRVPNYRGCADLRKSLDALEAKGSAALHESQTLASLRDALLPQLLSGKLCISDAEKIVENAV